MVFKNNIFSHSLLLKYLNIITSADVFEVQSDDDLQIPSVGQRDNGDKTASVDKQSPEPYNVLQDITPCDKTLDLTVSRCDSSDAEISLSRLSNPLDKEILSNSCIKNAETEPVDLTINHKTIGETNSTDETTATQRLFPSQTHRKVYSPQSAVDTCNIHNNTTQSIYHETSSVEDDTNEIVTTIAKTEQSQTTNPVIQNRCTQYSIQKGKRAHQSTTYTSNYGPPLKKARYSFKKEVDLRIILLRHLFLNQFFKDIQEPIIPEPSEIQQHEKELPNQGKGPAIHNSPNKAVYTPSSDPNNLLGSNSTTYEAEHGSNMKKSVVKLQGLSSLTRRIEDCLVAISKVQHAYNIYIFHKPSFILLDTPYSLNKRVGDVCDSLFYVNERIVFCKGNDNKFDSIFLEFDESTKKIIFSKYMEKQDTCYEIIKQTSTFSRKFQYKLPIFSALNFETQPNLKYLKIKIFKKNKYSIIHTIKFTVHFAGGLEPIINNTSLKILKIENVAFLVENILSAEFPIYHLALRGDDHPFFQFDELKQPEERYIKGSMKIRNYLNTFNIKFFVLRKRVSLPLYKEISEIISFNNYTTVIARDIAICLIEKACLSFKVNLEKIQKLVEGKGKPMQVVKEELDLLILAILKDLRPIWSIKDLEKDIITEDISRLISCYSFFYYEVKHVLEYWLKSHLHTTSM